MLEGRAIAALSMAAILSAPAGGPAQAARPIAEAAMEQFQACIADASRPRLRRFDQAGVPAPPGLARGGGMTVVEVPTDRGRLYAYRDHDPGVGPAIVCGVAVYGVDPEPIAERLAAMVKAQPLHFADYPATYYKLAEAKPGRVRYFGDSLAPGLHGALIIERPIGSDAPSLEADYHVTLLF